MGLVCPFYIEVVIKMTIKTKESLVCLGKIYSTVINDLSTHKKVREAFGLNDDWEPNLDLVTPEDLGEAWIAAATEAEEFQSFANSIREEEAPEDELGEHYYKNEAEFLWRESHGDDGEVNSDHLLACPYSFCFTHELRLEIWKSLRIKGRIGIENAVLIDVYELPDSTGYGPEYLRLSSYDVVCSTIFHDNGWGYPGAWIPDEHAVDEIKRRSALYMFGRIHHDVCQAGDNSYHVALDERYEGLKSPQFSEWQEAFEWLENKAAKLKLPSLESEKSKLLNTAKRRASRELAQEAIVIYNDWFSEQYYSSVSNMEL